MKKLLSYFNNRCICSSAAEAIQFINTLPSTVRGEQMICNEHTTNLLTRLFADEQIEGLRNGNGEIATTGCGKNRIIISDPLADTIEEHERISNELREKEEQLKRDKMQESLQKRLEELNECKKGWYMVSLKFHRAKFGSSGIYYADAEFSCKMIADSGIDAYNKAIENLKSDIEILPDSIYPKPTSNLFWFEFLGVKTDDGYSTELWETWKEEKTI